jgi:hypothetical protein
MLRFTYFGTSPKNQLDIVSLSRQTFLVRNLDLRNDLYGECFSPFSSLYNSGGDYVKSTVVLSAESEALSHFSHFTLRK